MQLDVEVSPPVSDIMIAYFGELVLPDGVQASNGVHCNYTDQTTLNKRGVSFLGECIVSNF